MSKKNKWVLVAIIMVSVSMLWGELFTQILLPQKVDSVVDIYRPDPIIGYTYQANAEAFETGREYKVAYSTNSMGMRDREYDLGEKDVFRILLLGDSFSEGHGVAADESLPKQIEYFLRRKVAEENSQIKIEVINACVGGYSPYHYWKSYERWKSIFQPKIILVGFYIGNDFFCEDENTRYVFDGGEIVGQHNVGEAALGVQQKSLITFTRKWLARNSEFYVLMRNFFYYNNLMEFMKRWTKDKVGVDQLKAYMVPESPKFLRDREKCFEYLKRLSEEAAADGVYVGVIAIPMKIEIVQDEFKRIVLTQEVRPDQIDVEQPYTKLIELCRSMSIYFFDIRADMKNGCGSGQSCYFQYDGHWNNIGIRVAAKSVISQWAKSGLTPFD
jgi:hypothetical protein